MKIALLFLVLVNVLFMSWSRWVAQTPLDQQVATPEPKTEKLVLFEEKFPERAATMREARLAEQREEAAARAAEGALPGEVDASALLLAEAPTAAEPELEPPDASAQVPADDEAAKALIDEAIEQNAAAAADAAPLLTMTDDGPPAARCVKLGPFVTLREATNAAAMLRSISIEPTQRLDEAQVWVGFWVYLPSFPSRAQAVAVVEQLRADGVSDIYIEPSGVLRNSISLGLFSDEAGAQTRADKISALGITPQIRDRYRDGSVYWVDFELPPGRNLDPRQFGTTPNRVIELTEQPCPGADA